MKFEEIKKGNYYTVKERSSSGHYFQVGDIVYVWEKHDIEGEPGEVCCECSKYDYIQFLHAHELEEIK